MAERRLTDAELDRQIEEAVKRGEEAAEREPRAVQAYYDAAAGRVVVELRDGCLFAFPAEAAQGLRGATPEQLADVEVIGGGYALHWEALDADLTVAGLLAGRLGSRVWMREHARRAGSATSEAKARAARANGARGGRPRKSSSNPQGSP